MKIVTLAAAVALAISSMPAFAQSTNAPGASNIGGEPNPNRTGDSTSGATNTQRTDGVTTGKSSTPASNDASKSGAPNADNAEKSRNAPTPDDSTKR